MATKKTTKLSIRDAHDNECDAIREVALAAYEQYATIMPPPAWAGYRRTLLATLDPKVSVERIIAELDHIIVGSVLLYPANGNTYPGMLDDLKWPEVRLLAVSPTVRGKGIGKALMEECVRRARQTGATVLGLHTMDMMQTAMQMYERMGFVHIPSLDFRPAENVLVKGYQLNLT